MFDIKIKVTGYLINLTENTQETIDTNAIKKSNIISYVIDNVKHKLILDESKITLLRESDEFSHGIIFDKNNITSSEYYLKKSNYSIQFNISTTELIISKNKINITYQIIESENIYNYKLEMSDNL